MKFRKARLSDAEAIKALLSLYPDDILQVPLFHIYSNIREFFVAEDNGEVVGVVALRIFWSDLAEVRSLAVKPSHSRKRIGSTLVNLALAEDQRFGITRVFTLTRVPAI